MCVRGIYWIFIFQRFLIGFWNGVRVMVFNATFNNISVISWRSVLLVEETEVPGENHRPVASNWQALLNNVASITPRLLFRIIPLIQWSVMFCRPCFNRFWRLKYIPRLFSEYMLTFRVEEPMTICVTN
jgi:hypothetical protein